jgi:hypothetical protein
MATNGKEDHVAISFNLPMYEDGRVSPASLDAVKLFGHTVRGN